MLQQRAITGGGLRHAMVEVQRWRCLRRLVANGVRAWCIYCITQRGMLWMLSESRAKGLKDTTRQGQQEAMIPSRRVVYSTKRSQRT